MNYAALLSSSARSQANSSDDSGSSYARKSEPIKIVSHKRQQGKGSSSKTVKTKE